MPQPVIANTRIAATTEPRIASTILHIAGTRLAADPIPRIACVKIAVNATPHIQSLPRLAAAANPIPRLQRLIQASQ